MKIPQMAAIRRALSLWINSSQPKDNGDSHTDKDAIDWVRIIPFIVLHMIAITGAVFTGFSWAAFIALALSYFVRMFAITGFYHRYFSHRTFKAHRFVQFGFAVLGLTATQRGPLWWAAHHRHHHRYADTHNDPHAPLHGFWWSHAGWFLSRRHYQADYDQIRDFAQYPELCWLDRHELLIPVLYATSFFLLGWGLEIWWPELNTGAWQMLCWGYFLSTVVLIHATLTINSLAHRWGRRRYETRDDSRNNWCLALLTLGEGWHNNHHHYPGSVRQGFYWWEVDVTYYLLRAMNAVGLIYDLKAVPPALLNARRVH
jgi:stearoyl-CoA desaturase (delta-9 desaturase)